MVVQETPRAPREPREPRETRPPRLTGRKAAFQQATDAAIALLNAGESLHLLTDLEDVFAPLKQFDQNKKSRPWWQPPMPGITDLVHVVTGYTWERPYAGPAVVLDRSGSWVAAASSVDVAHGQLLHTGPLPLGFEDAPGYYLTEVYEWPESHQIPSPLGHARPGTQVWVPSPTMALLDDLAARDRWPGAVVLDSYTGRGCRLTDWTKHVNTLRAYAIHTWGRESDQYAHVKENFGQAMSLQRGKIKDGRRIWACQSRRRDHVDHIESQGAATHWRWADDARIVCPDLPPISLRAMDELVVPAAALAVLTTKDRPGGRRPLEIDESGIKLGSYKIKAELDWGVAA